MPQPSSTQRIAPLDPPYSASLAETFSRVMPPGREPLNLFRTMARSTRILQRMFAGSLLDKGSVSLRDRELVILRTCARCRAEYEWGVHVTFFADKAMLTPAQVAATLATDTEPVWSERDRLLLRLVDELHDEATLSDALWLALEREFDAEQLLELIALTGYYHTISFLANGVRIENEPYAARFRSA